MHSFVHLNVADVNMLYNNNVLSVPLRGDNVIKLLQTLNKN